LAGTSHHTSGLFRSQQATIPSLFSTTNLYKLIQRQISLMCCLLRIVNVRLTLYNLFFIKKLDVVFLFFTDIFTKRLLLLFIGSGYRFLKMLSFPHYSSYNNEMQIILKF